MKQIKHLTRPKFRTWVQFFDEDQIICSGVSQDNTTCPIAKYLRYLYPNAQTIAVQSRVAIISDLPNYNFPTYVLPQWVQKFIRTIDYDRHSKPITAKQVLDALDKKE